MHRVETLKKHLPFPGEAGLQELKKVAARFEQRIYDEATTMSDYLRKISLKMLTMETKSQKPVANSLQSSAASNVENSQDTELKLATSISSLKRKKEHEIDTTGTVDVELISKIRQLAERSNNAASKDHQLEEIVCDLYLHLNSSQRLDTNKFILHACASEVITEHLSDYEDPKMMMVLKDDAEVLQAMKMQTWLFLVNLARGLL